VARVGLEGLTYRKIIVFHQPTSEFITFLDPKIGHARCTKCTHEATWLAKPIPKLEFRLLPAPVDIVND
jgi:hypothetical protein